MKNSEEIRTQEIECPECCGGGFTMKLHSSGPSEVNCEQCDGYGMIEVLTEDEE